MLSLIERVESLTDLQLALLTPEELKELQAAVWMERSEAAQKTADKSMQHFRSAVLIDTPGGGLVPYESVLEPWQRPDVEALDPAIRNVMNPGSEGGSVCKRFYYERARGHSKTTDQAIIVLGMTYGSKRKLSGVIGSGTKDQAALLRQQAEKVVSLNPWILDRVEVTKYAIANKVTGTEFKILTSDENSNYGETPDVVIVDELTVWQRRGLWDALFSAVAKVPHCFCIVISNAGRNKGTDWQWAIRERAREDAKWRFSTTNGPVASWITPEALEEQRGLILPSEYRRVFLNEWQSGQGDTLERSMIEAVFDEDMRKGFAGRTKLVSLDLGLKHDHAALVVTFGDAATNRYFTPYVKNWRPSEQSEGKVDLAEVRATAIELVRKINADTFVFDPWQADLLATDVTEATGVQTFGIDPTPKNKGMIARRCFDIIRERRWQAIEDEGLRADLEGVVFKEPTRGGIEMILPRSNKWGHADRLSAASMALAFGYEVSREVRKANGIASRDEDQLSGDTMAAA